MNQLWKCLLIMLESYCVNKWIKLLNYLEVVVFSIKFGRKVNERTHNLNLKICYSATTPRNIKVHRLYMEFLVDILKNESSLLEKK